MLPEAQITHAIPGRLRLRVPERKGDVEYFARVEQELRGIEGVSDVTCNPLTGSALIRHRSEREAVLAAASERDLFGRLSDQPPVSLLDTAIGRTEGLERTISDITEGQFHLFELLFTGLIFAAIIQTLRGRFLAPATTLLSYAVTLLAFYRSRRPSS